MFEIRVVTVIAKYSFIDMYSLYNCTQKINLKEKKETDVVCRACMYEGLLYLQRGRDARTLQQLHQATT